jgi:hypothetical protein
LRVKISLGRPVLPDRRKKILQFTVGKRRALRDGRQRKSKKDPIDEGAHSLILCSRMEF